MTDTCLGADNVCSEWLPPPLLFVTSQRESQMICHLSVETGVAEIHVRTCLG